MLCSNGHNNNQVNNVRCCLPVVFMADTWALGEDREVWIRVGFCPEETSSGPLCEWFQACPWTRITGVTHVPCEAAPVDLSCFIGSCGPAPCYHGHAIICSPAVVSARKLPRRWASSFWISASGKGCLSAQVPPHFCLALSIHPTKLLFLQQSWVGSCLVGAETSRLGLITLAAAQWRPLQQVREATCTSLVYILLNLAIHELYLMCSFSLEQSGPDLTNPLPYPSAGFWTPEQAVCGLLSLRSFLKRLWRVQQGWGQGWSSKHSLQRDCRLQAGAGQGGGHVGTTCLWQQAEKGFKIMVEQLPQAALDRDTKADSQVITKKWLQSLYLILPWLSAVLGSGAQGQTHQGSGEGGDSYFQPPLLPAFSKKQYFVGYRYKCWLEGRSRIHLSTGLWKWASGAGKCPWLCTWTTSPRKGREGGRHHKIIWIWIWS